MAAEKLGLEVAVEGFKQFMSQMGKMDGAIDGTGKKWGGLSGIAGKAGKALGTVAKVGIGAVVTGATAAVGAVGGLAVGIGKLASEAAPVAGLASAFERLTADITGGSDAMLASLQDASGGMIANRDLMESFNKAASLVSKDFAEQLPDAMQYLGKVSAATGTDLDYLLDSLVTGVGRLSPMILDNLAIQVNATEANEAYAKSHGVLVEEMSKAEQQTAMMDLVLEKLAANTADMPDVSGSAAQGMASLGATLQNVKDEVGLAFLPVLQTVMGELGKLAAQIGPKVIEWAKQAGQWLGENLPMAIYAISETFKDFLGGDLEGGLNRIQVLMGELFGPGAAEMFGVFQNAIVNVVEWVQGTLIPALQSFSQWFLEEAWPAIQNFAIQVYEFLLPAFQQLGEWIMQAVEAILPLLAQAFAWVKDNMEIVVPVLAAIGVLIAALNAPILLIVGAIVLFAKAWAENWGGIQEKSAAVVTFLEDLWNNILIPAMQAIWAFISDKLIPIFKQNVEVVTAIVGPAIRTLAEIWETILYPALQRTWDFITNCVIPIFKALAEVGQAILGLAIKVVTALFEKNIETLKTIWAFIKDNIIPIFKKLGGVTKDTLGGPLQWLAENILPKTEKAFNAIKDAVSSVVDWIQRLADKIRSIEIPDWLQGHSPPPMAFWFGDIAAAVRQLSAVELPRLIADFNAMGSTMPVPAMPGGNVSTYNYATTNNYNLTTQSITRPGGLRMEFDAMALATR